VLSVYLSMFKTIEIRKKYYKDRYYQRINKLISILGGKCVKCDNISSLEFDHIDPKTKEFNIASHLNYAWSRILKELKKCQLLCKIHHKEKSISEGSFSKNKIKKVSDKDFKIIISKIFKGQSIRSVGREYGISHHSIIDRMKRHSNEF